VAATRTIGSDGAVTSVRMVEAKLAAARLIPADVMFAPEFPAGYGSAGRAARRSAGIALVAVEDVRQALAWLCGRTAGTVACAAATAPIGSARPYTHTAAITAERTRPTTST
jgi:PDZ domain-containing secreted protein